jgi:hypothetical protein
MSGCSGCVKILYNIIIDFIKNIIEYTQIFKK